MKHNILYGMLMPFGVGLALAAGLSSCGKEALQSDAESYDSTMSFNVLAPGATPTKVSGNAFEAGDKAGLYVTDYVDENTPMPLQISGNRASNVAMTCDGTGWSTARQIFWGEGKSDVYAYFPYMENIDDINSQYFAVSTDQTKAKDGDEPSAYEVSDFLWAKAEGVSRSGGAVSLAMKHLMSKLTVKIVAGEKYIGSLPEDATVLLHNTVTGARINLENGSVFKDSHSGAQTIKMKNLGLKTADGVDAVVYEAVVVPQMLQSRVPLIEINSKSVSYLLEDSFNFRPGTAYIYTATLNASTTAIKVEIGCEIDDWNSTGSGTDQPGGGDQPGGDDDGTVYTDLSAEGTANCYLIKEAGNYRFKAVQGNLDATVGNVKSVEVLWESFGTDVQPNVGDLIASVSYRNGYVRFKTPEAFADGNAVIAAKNSKGVILWSWHIWCAHEGFEEQVYYNNAGTMMDRNLGATSATPGEVGCLGLLYQWGRKDPHIGSSSISEAKFSASTGIWGIKMGYLSVSFAEENPTIFSGNTMSVGSWTLMKSTDDPCPLGWKIPDKTTWTKACGTKDKFHTTYNEVNRGFDFSMELGDSPSIWYPASGYLGYPGELKNVGNVGYYNATPIAFFYFDTARNCKPNYSGANLASAVRCIKEQ
ncbi:MAG: fimbrillin family protein [Bacteroidales bacterium]|nr:fimbrillin family protein [Bacteroidales bacterium]